MRLTFRDQITARVSRNNAIRVAFAKCLAQPAHIWEELEAKGIDVTPGMIHWAIADLHKPQQQGTVEGALEPLPKEAAGLTAEDMESLASQAAKAGGVKRLARFLFLMGESPV